MVERSPGTMWETIGSDESGDQVDRDAVVEPRLVERRRAGADDLRPRRPADLARLRDVHGHAAPERAQSARGVVPDAAGADPVAWEWSAGSRRSP